MSGYFAKSDRPRFEPPDPICDDAEFWHDGDLRMQRIWLSRKVADAGPVGLIIGLNPSTAGASVLTNDHTIKKLTVFSRQWGWSGFWMTNLFTHIETKSAKLKALSFDDAVGPYGSVVLDKLIPRSPHIVVCWGSAVPTLLRHRARSVLRRIQLLAQEGASISCFGTSKDSSPVHPLRLSYDTKLVPFLIESPIGRTDEL